jgi:phage shock protein E
MISFLKKLLGGNQPDWKLLMEKGAIVVDVRTPGEYAKGHVPKSINIPLPEIDRKLSVIKKYKKPIVTCCRSGARSKAAASKLQSYGLEAYNGGSWQRVQSLFKS